MKDQRVFIAAALESIELIQTYIHGYDLQGFLEDRKTQDAVIRNLEIIGQALKDFGVEELLQQQPGVPWRDVAGMRNILSHEYLGVDLVMVWDTIQIHLDTVRQALEKILNT